MANFVSYANAETLMTEIGNKFNALNGAYIIRGSSTFANLPTTLTKEMTGYVYNVTTDFTTTSLFVEGAGKKYSAGTNVVIVDVGAVSYNAVTPEGTENPSEEGWYETTSSPMQLPVFVLTSDVTVNPEKTYYEKTVLPNMRYDVLGNFIDVDAINAEIEKVSDMITDEDFDSTQAYAVGDIVKRENVLYKFKSAHTANTSWDATEVDEVKVVDLITASDPDSLTTAQVNALIALLN